MAEPGGSPKNPRTRPRETKLLICVHNPFSLWNPPPEFAGRIRAKKCHLDRMVGNIPVRHAVVRE